MFTNQASRAQLIIGVQSLRLVRQGYVSGVVTVDTAQRTDRHRACLIGAQEAGV
jgi:hypothetical protein